MKARIKDITLNLDRTVNLTLQMGSEGKLIAEQMNGLPVELEIKPYREKRSLTANAYAWVLIGKLADVMCIPKTEVYRHAIRDVPRASDLLVVKKESLHAFVTAWEAHGIGWMAIPEYSDYMIENDYVRIYYGSSVFDTRQMACLIDSLIAECYAQGIETLPPKDIDRMMQLYENQRGKRA